MKKKITKLDSIFYYLELFENEKRSELLLRVGFEVGGNLLNRMWKPKPFIQKMIDYYLENIFMDSYVIGLQIRYDFLYDNLDW